MKYEGYNGQIELGENELVITREGFRARAVFGETPVRRIPTQALSGVRLKEASRFKNGWIQLLLGGELDEEPTSNAATSNANTILFTHKNGRQFHELHDRLAAIVDDNVKAGIDFAQVDWDHITGQHGRFDKRAARAAAAPEEKMLQRQADAEAAGLRPDIAAASARMIWTFGGKREIKNLEKYLHEGERVSCMAQGEYHDKMGIVALTDRRLLFVHHGVAGASVEDFPLERINSVETSAGMGTGDLTVHASGNSAVIKSVSKTDLNNLSEAVRQSAGRAASALQAATSRAQSLPTQIDVADQLERLDALRERGVLTEEEFAAQKAKLLG